MQAPIHQEVFEGNAVWRALYTRHQYEKLVASVLSIKGFDVFLPLYSSVRKWKDRMKELSLPLFPSYVFVRDSFSRRLQILTTPGVHKMLMVGGQPAVIPEAEIEAIRRAVQTTLRVEPHPFLRCGDRVRVKSGPLEGVEGILTRKKNLYRLILSVDLLGQSAAVEVDAAIVEPLSSHSRGLLFAPHVHDGLIGHTRFVSQEGHYQ